uniref:Uncharacterized protein n=1 Tax=Cuerna arida TaxID=1464854 RepID=A0A1B6GRG9_9HEMI
MASEILESLETTFGKIPKEIEENAKNFNYSNANDEFTCIPCNRVIEKIYNKSSSTSIVDFEGHLASKKHKESIVPMSVLMDCLMETFSGEIPQIVLNHILVLTVDDFYYICAICEKMIGVSNCSSSTETNFSYHLLSVAHTNNMKSFNAILSQLQNIYGSIPPVVLNNSSFLEIFEGDNKYLCSICDETLSVNLSAISKSKESFENHFYSLEHINNVKINKILSLIPLLENSLHFPRYLITSIEYFSKNDTNFFCVLCNENVKFCLDAYETEQNFKAHILSEFHQQNLKFRRDPSNEVFIELLKVFETLPSIVVENLGYFTLYEKILSCSICEEFIIEEKDSEKTLKNIISHLKSDWHDNNVTEEKRRQQMTVHSLKNLFGSVPKSIQDNIDHLKFSEKTNDFECLLCNIVVESNKGKNAKPQNVACSLEKNSEKHFKSNKHLQQEQNLDSLSESIRSDLEEIFCSIPHFVVINWDYIDYDVSGEHFNCALCDTKILVDNGNKMDKVTSQNFRTHFFSAEHLSAVKKKANEKQVTVDKLDAIFGRVPSYILSNIDHIIEKKGEFYCKPCNKKFDVRSAPENIEHCFYEHLSGTRHKSYLRKYEVSHDAALERLDKSFSKIPEFLLRNIYHLCLYNNILFCLVCQKLLPIDGQDLESSKRFLRCHMESEQHKGNVKFV